MPPNLALLLAEFGGGAPNNGTAEGPRALTTASFWPALQPLFHQVIRVRTNYTHPNVKDVRATQAVITFCKTLQHALARAYHAGQIPLVIGGDHTIAMATWSAIASRTAAHSLGLLWIDAHLDAHTPSTSLSQSLHGMPLAVLLGEGDPTLLGLAEKQPPLIPEHCILLGPRHYEPGEVARLKRLGVKIYFDDEIKQRGFEACWQEALSILNRTCDHIGVSFDLDALDPKLIPGVGSAVANGLDPIVVRNALQGFLHHPKCVAVEIAEFNPYRDRNNQTLQYLYDLIIALQKEAT